MFTGIPAVVRGKASALRLAGLAAALVLAVLPAAGIDMFLTIQDREGATVPTDAEHSWVNLLGFEQGLEREVVTGTGGAGEAKATGRECALVLAQDRCVASLMKACAIGEKRDLTLHVVRQTGERDYSVMTELRFEDAFITAVEGEMAEDQGDPIFRVRLVYAKLSWANTWYDTKQVLKAGQVEFDFTTQEIFGVSSQVPELGEYVEGGGGPVDPDADDDGIPDDWETANGLSPSNAADANEDRDKDGRSNKDEYVAGTNPNSGASFFRATVQGPGAANPGQVTLTWSSVAGKSYKVMAASEPGGTYAQVAVVAGLAGETSHTVAAGSGRFFKVVVE